MAQFDITNLINPAYLPVAIFFARVTDVTLGTLRIVFLSSGKRMLAPVLGFLEVLIWVVVISQIVNRMSTPISYIAYAAGFATGTLVGLLIEERLALGTLMVRAITLGDGDEIRQRLRTAGHGVTSIAAYGSTGQATVIYSIIKRKQLPEVLQIVRAVEPHIFVSVEELRSVSEGVFRPERPALRNRLRASRQGK